MKLDELYDDALVHVFDYLGAIDLVKLCDTSKRFRNVIVNQVIGRKFIDFMKCQSAGISAIKIFKLFGKAMTNIKISVDNIPDDVQRISHGKKKHTKFDEILSLIIKYGQEAKLLGLDIHIDFRSVGSMNYKCDELLLAAALPFFKNITDLRVYHCHQKGSRRVHDLTQRWDDLLLNVFPYENVCSLELIGIYTAGDWLLSSSLQKVQHLRLPCTKIRDFNNFESFLMRKPNLKTFHIDSIKAQSRANRYLAAIACHTPDIEDIDIDVGIDRNSKWHWYDFVYEDDDDDDYDDYFEDKWQETKHFKEFKNLKTLRVDVVHIENGIFDDFPKQNSLQTLIVDFFHDEYFLDLDFTNVFVKLTNLSLLHFREMRHTLFEMLLPNISPYLSSIKEFHLTIDRLNLKTLRQILESMSSLHSLVIKPIQLTCSKRAYLSLVKVWKNRQSQQQPLTIYLTAKKVKNWRELVGEAYDENVIALSARKREHFLLF